MTKSGAEKRRLRRAPQNELPNPSSSSSSTKKPATKDAFQVFADKVRDNKQLESRWAIMQETRVEYFRGKDFPVFLRNHPEVKEILGSDRDLDAEDIVNTLLRKNLLVRCDRVVKTFRPGKKKLSSWPAHLEIHPDQSFVENDAFFAWTFMKRRALWQTILSLLWPLVALAVCLFPVYPYQCKIVVLYSCAGALFFIVTLLLIVNFSIFPFPALAGILGECIVRRLHHNHYLMAIAEVTDEFSTAVWVRLCYRPWITDFDEYHGPSHQLPQDVTKYPGENELVVDSGYLGYFFWLFPLCVWVRGAIFGVLYVVLGKRIWFFPNINVEETTFQELFRFWPKKDEGEPPKWTSRLTYAVVAGLFILLLRHHAPDEAARARYQKKVSNIIDDVLEWSPKLALSGMMDTQQTVVNATETSKSTSRAGAAEESADKESMESGSDGDGDDDAVSEETDHIG